MEDEKEIVALWGAMSLIIKKSAIRERGHPMRNFEESKHVVLHFPFVLKNYNF